MPVLTWLIFPAILALGFFMIKLEECLEKRIEETNRLLEELIDQQNKHCFSSSDPNNKYKPRNPGAKSN